jgi:hypothetical protein
MRPISLFCLLTLVTSCGDGPTGDIFAVEGIVEGQLTSPEGTPVSGAWVALDGLYPLANGTTTPLYGLDPERRRGALSGTTDDPQYARYAGPLLDQDLAPGGQRSGSGRDPQSRAPTHPRAGPDFLRHEHPTGSLDRAGS